MTVFVTDVVKLFIYLQFDKATELLLFNNFDFFILFVVFVFVFVFEFVFVFVIVIRFEIGYFDFLFEKYFK